jgi:hypothetical protein
MYHADGALTASQLCTVHVHSNTALAHTAKTVGVITTKHGLAQGNMGIRNIKQGFKQAHFCLFK